MYEFPRTIPDVKMLLAPEELGINDPLPLEEADFKAFKANGAIVRCPSAVQ